MRKCAKCGKELTLEGPDDGKNLTLAGIASKGVQVFWEDSEPGVAAFIRANLGKYAPADKQIKSVEFLFCLECYIDSLMFSDPFPRKYIDVTAVGDEKPKYLICPQFTEEMEDVARKIIESNENEGGENEQG